MTARDAGEEGFPRELLARVAEATGADRGDVRRAEALVHPITFDRFAVLARG